MSFQIVRARACNRGAINSILREIRIGAGSVGSLRRTWIAKVDGEVAGFASLDFAGGKAGILKGLAVKEEFRYRGIGSALIKVRMKTARKRGVKIFALATVCYKYNFYKQYGFQTCPRRFLPDFLRNYPQFKKKRYMKCAVMVKGIPIKRHD